MPRIYIYIHKHWLGNEKNKKKKQKGAREPTRFAFVQGKAQPTINNEFGPPPRLDIQRKRKRQIPPHFLKQILSILMTGASNRADMTKAEKKDTTALPRNRVRMKILLRWTVPLMCEEQMNMMMGWIK